MISKIKNNFLIIIFSIFYISVGLFTYKDYGVGIEEHFQRSSGFYWLDYILQYSNFSDLKILVQQKILEIKNFSPNLPPLEIANYYGVLFDLPMAFLESIFNIDDSENYFFLRHLTNFLFFFISGIFFYNIIVDRTSSRLIGFLGTFMYLLSPKVYGNSFFDGKDIFFLSIVTISFYFYLNFEKKRNIKSLILLALLCSFATSSRIFGLMLPISFLFLILMESINYKDPKFILQNIFKFILLYFIFLYLHWPYMWTLNLNELGTFFEPFKVHGYYKVFFDGTFYESNRLPIFYLPKWIFISSPLFYSLLFLIGISFFSKRIFYRFLNIKIKTVNNDLWKGKLEKFDFFVFFSLFQVIAIYLTLNINLIKGWTHFLFLNFFLIYFGALGIYFINIILKKYKSLLRILLVILLFCFFELTYKLYVYHPFQSIYFNNFLNKEDKNGYEIDYQSLTRSEALKEIINDAKKDVIKIGTASWTPLKNGVSMIPLEKRKKIIFTGTNDKVNADYIYTNHFYEIDVRYDKKYEIPDNFYLFKSLFIDDIRVYSIYKNKS